MPGEPLAPYSEPQHLSDMLDARTIAKTTPPDLARAISRPRLIQRIYGAGAVRVILITGQAAQGKSTLAAQISRQLARQRGATVTQAGAWMHLDPADSDTVNFLHLLIHSLKISSPNLDAAPFLNHSAVGLQPDSSDGRMAQLAGTFMDQVIARAPVRIVIDGLDRLAESAASLKLIDRLIEVIAPPSCLVLVSRQTPPLRLQSLRIHQELIVLDNDDLAFSTNEIRRFFSDLYGLRLGSSQLSRIRRLTDGWIGGLVLMWEVLRHVPEGHHMEVIDNGLPGAMHDPRLAYFSEAVFADLDRGTQDFLIRSAIFDTIDPQMAVRYLDNQSVVDVKRILDSLVRQNLFVNYLFDPKTGWGYRYNQLFRDFLLDKFHDDLKAAEQQQLLTRAADLAWDAGNFEAAIGFLLKAKAFEKAAAGIKKIAMGLSAQGRFADLAGWFDNLPNGLINDDAWLSFYEALSQRIRGGRKTIASFSEALEGFRAQGDQRGQLLALAYLIEGAVFIGHPAADLNRWLEAAWSLLANVSGNRYYAFAKATLWMQVAFGYFAGAGNLQKGLSACRNAMLLANTIDDDTLTANATIIHVFGLSLTGEVAAAQKALSAIAPLVADVAYPEYRALKNIVLMELSLSVADLDRAQDLRDTNHEKIEKFGLLFLYPIHVDLSGLLQIYQGRFDDAGHTASHLNDVATLAANPFYRGLALRLRALKAYHQGRFAHACRWAEQAVAVIGQSLGESVHLFRSRLILGMAAYHLEKWGDAWRALESADDFFKRVSSHLSLAEARIGLSLVARAMNNQQTADRYLASALSIAAQQGYEAFPMLSAHDMLAACKPALTHVRSRFADTARRFVDRLQVNHPLPARPHGTDAHPQGQRAILRSKTTRPEATQATLEIRTLGGFNVRRADGEVISDVQWAGQRQKLLLKAIIVNGCREIPKDILMDALWPDSRYDATLKRFKVTLHRLRKILEPDMDQRAGSSCILLKDNLVSLDTNRCRVDVNAFLAVCDEIRQLKRNDDDQLRLAACRRAADIYLGDFLPEEPYLRWAEMKRAALKDQYIGVRMEMAGLYEEKGQLAAAVRQCKAVIQSDPLTEQAHQQLMRLLQRQGRRSAALKTYRKLTKMLAAELDTAPDPATTRIYKEIVGK